MLDILRSMKLMSILKQAITNERSPRYRDRRAFYASELTKDARDLFWSLTGEPATNPSDLVGSIRMGLGNAIEGWVIDQLKQGHLFGLRLVGSQIPVGGSDPVNVDGYLDALVEDANGNKHVVEIKTKWGWGGTFFARDRNPGDNYMAQMGYYLRDLDSKGITNTGVFLFVPFSDDTFGDIIAIFCEYDRDTGIVSAYSSQGLYEEEPRPLDISLNINAMLEKLKLVEEHVKAGTLPPVDKQHKYPVTTEMLSTARESDLKKALEGNKVIGDWEISYSAYKNKHIELQGTSGGYSEEELSLIAAELEQRAVAKKASANAKRAATIAAKKRSA